ncbi:T9SS type A sorting domain-containing protein [Dyadobacter arcticus]|uniref:Secretion system C-terminal sorting domain-containing protein n=1 Tax=Dyadobacter arcticus TaxID=1078754 RepID=A0ABX0UI03_9BACT|nr:T9SS type A sorting domain-containing protein [Dyadobacter arcticus]NIJ52654.1 hypothetical protein [Dyadobacter arcticus]
MEKDLLLNRLAGFCFFMLLATSLPAQVIYDNNAQCAGSSADGSTLSLANFTVPANDRAALVVLIRSTQTRTVSSLTFGGQSLTRLNSVFSYFNARAEVWYLALGDLAVPITGNIEVVWDGNNIYRMLTVLSAHNVDQATPLDNLTGNGFPVGSTSSSLSVAGSSGDLAVEAISCFGPSNLTPPVFTPTSGQTGLALCSETPVFTFVQAAAYKMQTGPTTLSWSISNLEPTTNAGIQIAANIRADASLPVTLINFQAQHDGEASKLTWETASEYQSDYFEVQHSSNGQDFREIGRVAAAGESTKTWSYTFSHDQRTRQAQADYYRLKCVDLDGSYMFSRIASVWNGKATETITAYPNPTKNGFTLQAANRQQTVNLYDGQGRLVYNSKKVPEHVEMSHLPQGMYVLQVGTAVIKVVKE